MYKENKAIRVTQQKPFFLFTQNKQFSAKCFADSHRLKEQLKSKKAPNKSVVFKEEFVVNEGTRKQQQM